MSKNKDNSDKKNSPRIQMDEISKLLFSSSKEMTVKIINYLFNENFECNEVTLSNQGTEFIENNTGNITGTALEVVRSDEIVKIRENDSMKEHFYHIEFQTLNDTNMIFRMFRYALNFIERKCKEISINDFSNVYMPKQCVIFFEENSNIEDTLQLGMNFSFPHIKYFQYIVPTIKFWEFSVQKLKENELYILIPLKLFDLRKRLNEIDDKKELLEEFEAEIYNTAVELVNISAQLRNDKIINDKNFDDILSVIMNIFSYYDLKYYDGNMKIKNEVINMVQSVLKPAIQEGVKRGVAIVKLILQGYTDDKIAEKLKCSEDEIREARKDFGR